MVLAAAALPCVALSMRPACVAPSLCNFIEKRLRTAVHPAVPPPLATVLSDLVKQAPSESVLNAWCHQQATAAAVSLEKDESLRRRFVSGELSLLDVAEAAACYSEAAEEMYNTINGHHRDLRRGVSAAGGADGEDGAASAWQAATADADALRSYADAASRIGTRGWVRRGIDWCAETATRFFREGGALTLARREAAHHSMETRGAVPEPEAVAGLLDLVGSALPGPDEPIRLLDVGACGNLFGSHAGIRATPIDLCPQAGSTEVLQCDFLQLGIGAPASEPRVLPSAEFAAGSLEALPAASYDVVAMSLVLSYLPSPAQRGAMVAKARQLLPTPEPPAALDAALAAHTAAGAAAEAAPPPEAGRGLLLLVDTFSVDKRKRTWQEQTYLRAWVGSIEQLGFRFLRHQTLSRSHALAFATAPLAPAELRALAGAQPELVMRREAECGGEWHDHELGDGSEEDGEGGSE